jgi:hypothetical protein
MISYQIDLDKPFTILERTGPDEYKVVGWAKEYWIAGGYRFGGIPNEIFTLRMWDMFTKSQKRTLQWYKRVMGDYRERQVRKKLSAGVIARHSKGDNDRVGI